MKEQFLNAIQNDATLYKHLSKAKLKLIFNQVFIVE